MVRECLPCVSQACATRATEATGSFKCILSPHSPITASSLAESLWCHDGVPDFGASRIQSTYLTHQALLASLPSLNDDNEGATYSPKMMVPAVMPHQLPIKLGK
jgi:hypothetical protein